MLRTPEHSKIGRLTRAAFGVAYSRPLVTIAARLCFPFGSRNSNTSLHSQRFLWFQPTATFATPRDATAHTSKLNRNRSRSELRHARSRARAPHAGDRSLVAPSASQSPWRRPQRTWYTNAPEIHRRVFVRPQTRHRQHPDSRA